MATADCWVRVPADPNDTHTPPAASGTSQSTSTSTPARRLKDDLTVGQFIGYASIVGLSFTVTNIWFLCLSAAFLGCMGRRWSTPFNYTEPRADLREVRRAYTTATLRGFLAYLIVIAGYLIVLPENTLNEMTPGQYARLAGAVSALAFVVGWEPESIIRLVTTVFSAAKQPPLHEEQKIVMQAEVKSTSTEVKATSTEVKSTETTVVTSPPAVEAKTGAAEAASPIVTEPPVGPGALSTEAQPKPLEENGPTVQDQDGVLGALAIEENKAGVDPVVLADFCRMFAHRGWNGSETLERFVERVAGDKVEIYIAPSGIKAIRRRKPANAECGSPPGTEAQSPKTRRRERIILNSPSPPLPSLACALPNTCLRRRQ